MVISCTKSSVPRQFSHKRFLFLLTIVLNTLQIKDQTNQVLHRTHFEKDLKYCHKCFEHQIQHCVQFFRQIKPDKEFSKWQLLNFLPKSSHKRNYQVFQLKGTTEQVIAKYLFQHNNNQKYENIFEIDKLKGEFLKQQKQFLQGMQYAPLMTLDNFVEYLGVQQLDSYLSLATIWHYLLNDIQVLLYPVLKRQSFPVPKTYAVCGFTLYQQYAGQDLYDFFKTDFLTKLNIAQQLLQAALKFSYGFAAYRLYITDLTADNIVYDRFDDELKFIDLDTVFIVDSLSAKANKYKSAIHKHQYIECLGCFAYSADDIASYNLSDINIFSACQFLREDLFKDRTKGFLYPIPLEVTLEYPKLGQLLNKCVDCPDAECLERFTVAKDLIGVIGEILTN